MNHDKDANSVHKKETHEKKREESRLNLEALHTGSVILIHSPGMRIIKTGLAVIICLLLEYLRQSNNFIDSPIAAIIVLQQDTRKSWSAGLARVMGTAFAGIYAIAFLYLATGVFNLDFYSLPYLLLVGFMTIPLMQILVHLKQTSAVGVASIVFLLVCLSESALINPITYVPNRVINTIIGIIVSVVINWFPLLNKLGKKYDEGRQRAYVNIDAIHDQLLRLRAEEAEFEAKKDAERHKIQEHYAEDMEEWRNKNRY